MRHGTIISLPLFVGLVAALRLPGQPVDNKLSELCSGQKVHLKTVEELAELVALADSGRSTGCSPLVVEALAKMKEITDDKKACTMQKAEAITGFVGKYLKDSGEEIPEALSNFAVAYGMQVSGICSREMVDGFSRQADARVYDKVGPTNYTAYADFKEYLLNQSPASMILEPIVKTGEVILPADLVLAIPEVGAKLKLQLSKGDFYARLQRICTNVLRPLYESTLLPLAHLIRAGFVNRAHLRGRKFRDNGRFWSTAVFLCESLKLVEVEERNTPEQTAIESEIRETLGSVNGKELNSDLRDEQAESTPVSSAESDAEVGGKIVSSSVGSLVKGYEANKDETERLRELIAARSIRMLTMMTRKAKYESMLKDMLGMMRIEDEAEGAEFEKAKQSLMRFIEDPKREQKALKHQVREQNGDAVPGDFERKRSSWKGGLKTVILKFRNFIGFFVLLVYYIVVFIPKMVLVDPESPTNSLERGFAKLDKATRRICGWPEGIVDGVLEIAERY